MRRFTLAYLCAVIFTLLVHSAAWACVGKILEVGVVPRSEEKLLTQMLSILVNERTGTSVKIREFAGFDECFTALARSEIDMVVLFAGEGYAEVMSRSEACSSKTVMSEVKDYFNQNLNLVWLEPWGLLDDGRFVRDGEGRPLPTQAAPLVRKETLKKFPALARLVNKMSGRLNADEVAKMLRKAEGGDAGGVARQFLKAEKLI